jgi:ribosomal protein L11 methyltransferase
MPESNVPGPTVPFITLTAASTYEDAIGVQLYLLGQTELEILNPDAGTVQLTIYEPTVPVALVREGLDALAARQPGFTYELRAGEIPEVKWFEVWKQYFVPKAVGERFEVRPPWASEPVAPGRVPLLIEPGNAFGSGYHETTQLVLEALERLPLAGRSLLDAGCGSGILSIGALKLGAGPVLGFDVDPDSIENSIANARLNGVPAEFRVAEPADVAGPWDVVAANLIADLLDRVRDDLVRLTRAGGTLVLSGLLEGDQDATRDRYLAAGLTLLAADERNGWHSLVFRKP